MEGLRPCPFCGGEAKIQEYNGGFAAVGCSNGRCYMHPHAFGFASAEDAIQKWNRRAERTCYVELSHMEIEHGDYAYLEVELSCGHYFTWDDGTPPDYCPYCGAKVEVDE